MANERSEKRQKRRRRGGFIDIVNALLALGYNEKEALGAVKQLPDGVGVSDGIRQALKGLSKA